jgi:plasmid stabilization system protein ParE
MPHRGVSKPNLGDGIRTISFEGRALIAYRVDDRGVRIIRVIYAGRDYNSDDFVE